jgi:hypothetical protein
MNFTTRTSSTIILIATVLFSGTSAVRGSESVPEAAAVPTLISNASPEQLDSVEKALERFEAAGLRLPPISVSFHESADACHGYLGHYATAGSQLDMCNWGQSHISPINTLLHELAHAWSFEFLGEETRAAFIAHRELGNWDDRSVNWWLRGQEQAAEIVAWGLMDEPFRSAYVNSERCVDLATAFELLTGVAPLHTSTDHCG